MGSGTAGMDRVVRVLCARPLCQTTKTKPHPTHLDRRRSRRTLHLRSKAAPQQPSENRGCFPGLRKTMVLDDPLGSVARSVFQDSTHSTSTGSRGGRPPPRPSTAPTPLSTEAVQPGFSRHMPGKAGPGERGGPEGYCVDPESWNQTDNRYDYFAHEGISTKTTQSGVH